LLQVVVQLLVISLELDMAKSHGEATGRLGTCGFDC